MKSQPAVNPSVARRIKLDNSLIRFFTGQAIKKRMADKKLKT